MAANNENVSNGNYTWPDGMCSPIPPDFAGWGLKAVTSIPEDFVLGYFVVKAKDAEKPEEGTYNIRTQKGKYIVMEQLSLMNSQHYCSKRYRGAAIV